MCRRGGRAQRKQKCREEMPHSSAGADRWFFTLANTTARAVHISNNGPQSVLTSPPRVPVRFSFFCSVSALLTASLQGKRRVLVLDSVARPSMDHFQAAQRFWLCFLVYEGHGGALRPDGTCSTGHLPLLTPAKNALVDVFGAIVSARRGRDISNRVCHGLSGRDRSVSYALLVRSSCRKVRRSRAIELPGLILPRFL